MPAEQKSAVAETRPPPVEWILKAIGVPATQETRRDAEITLNVAPAGLSPADERLRYLLLARAWVAHSSHARKGLSARGCGERDLLQFALWHSRAPTPENPPSPCKIEIKVRDNAGALAISVGKKADSDDGKVAADAKTAEASGEFELEYGEREPAFRICEMWPGVGVGGRILVSVSWTGGWHDLLRTLEIAGKLRRRGLTADPAATAALIYAPLPDAAAQLSRALARLEAETRAAGVLKAQEAAQEERRRIEAAAIDISHLPLRGWIVGRADAALLIIGENDPSAHALVVARTGRHLAEGHIRKLDLSEVRVEPAAYRLLDWYSDRAAGSTTHPRAAQVAIRRAGRYVDLAVYLADPEIPMGLLRAFGRWGPITSELVAAAAEPAASKPAAAASEPMAAAEPAASEPVAEPAAADLAALRRRLPMPGLPGEE